MVDSYYALNSDCSQEESFISSSCSCDNKTKNVTDLKPQHMKTSDLVYDINNYNEGSEKKDKLKDI